jgi:hypothetical protein
MHTPLSLSLFALPPDFSWTLLIMFTSFLHVILMVTDNDAKKELLAPLLLTAFV